MEAPRRRRVYRQRGVKLRDLPLGRPAPRSEAPLGGRAPRKPVPHTTPSLPAALRLPTVFPRGLSGKMLRPKPGLLVPPSRIELLTPSLPITEQGFSAPNKSLHNVQLKALKRLLSSSEALTLPYTR